MCRCILLVLQLMLIGQWERIEQLWQEQEIICFFTKVPVLQVLRWSYKITATSASGARPRGDCFRLTLPAASPLWRLVHQPPSLLLMKTATSASGKQRQHTSLRSRGKTQRF